MTYRRNKYNNRKTKVDGYTFDSKKEAQRYFELKMLKLAGEISVLELQPQIPLLVNGQWVGKYIGDFSYRNKDGERVIEDVKSPATRTPIYNLKKKILATYDPPVLIKEVF
ncbi:MAG: DUF1064 domain-containing protein [Flavobacteriaceae bacterium]|nr:DUF1064 domain-containing protein [Flavobacteriaceae bacterium]